MIYVVTGLPRSGTTMMMRMLEVGGIDPYYDSDDELCNVLRETKKHRLLPADSKWVKDCEGMAVKILMPIIRKPPVGYRYKFIWCDRDAKERVKSHLKFVKKVLGKKLNKGMVRGKSRVYAERCIEFLSKFPDSNLMRIRFEEVLHDPRSAARRVAAFCEIPMDVEMMARSVVDRGKKCLPYLLEEKLQYA